MASVSLKKVGDNRYMLDLKGFVCPYPQLYTAQALKAVPKGTVIEVIIDNPPSCETVPDVAKKNGAKVLSMEQVQPGVWRIVIEK